MRLLCETSASVPTTICKATIPEWRVVHSHQLTIGISDQCKAGTCQSVLGYMKTRPTRPACLPESMKMLSFCPSAKMLSALPHMQRCDMHGDDFFVIFLAIFLLHSKIYGPVHFSSMQRCTSQYESVRAHSKMYGSPKMPKWRKEAIR